MKVRILCRPRMALAVVTLCSQIASVLLAQDSTPAPASIEAASPAPASETRPVQLSSGVAEILKLGRAQVGDEVIIAFVRNSGKSYHLSVSEILYLRAQGVSDQVVTAMLSAGQNVVANSAQPPPEPAPTQPPTDWANSSPQPPPAAPQFAPQPAPTYDAAASVYGQPGPVYAYPAQSYGDYGYSPYYWGYPAFSLGIGFGGGYYGGYYGRGYYGYRGGGYYGGYHGGGYHGGGYYHGGGGGHR